MEEAKRSALEIALREAKPRFLTDGFGLRGPPNESGGIVRRSDYPVGNVTRQPRQPAFPSVSTDTTVQQRAGGAIPRITFILSDATTSEGTPPVKTNKVLVADGHILDEFPTGMDGTGGFTITPTTPADASIFAGITFDPTTLAITSRFIDSSAFDDFPDSRVIDASTGFAYWQLGYTYLDDSDTFRVVSTLVGDINPIFIYGSKNNKPALFIFPDIGGINLDALFP